MFEFCSIHSTELTSITQLEVLMLSVNETRTTCDINLILNWLDNTTELSKFSTYPGLSFYVKFNVTIPLPHKILPLFCAKMPPNKNIHFFIQYTSYVFHTFPWQKLQFFFSFKIEMLRNINDKNIINAHYLFML